MRLRIASAIKTIAMIPPSELKVAIAAMLPTRLRSAISGETVLVALEVLVVLLLVEVVDVLELLLEELEELVELVVSDEVVLVSDEVVSEEVVSLEVVSEEVSELVSEVLSAVVSAVVSALVSAVVAVSAVSVASVAVSAVSVASAAVSESSVESPESPVESARFCLTSVVHVGALLGGGVGSGMLTVRAGRAWAGVCAGWSAHASRQRVCRARRIGNFIFIFFCFYPFLLFNLFSLAKSEAVRNEGEKSSREEKNNEAERSLSLQPFRARHETRTNQRGHSTANCSNGYRAVYF